MVSQEILKCLEHNCELKFRSSTGQEKIGAHLCHEPVMHLKQHQGEQNT